MARNNNRVLVIDMDPQGNCSMFFVPDIYSVPITIRNVLLEEIPIKKAVQSTKFKNIDIISSNLMFSGLDAKLAGSIDAQYLLRDNLEELKSKYDFCLLDCPPSLGLSTQMSLVAANYYLIPTEAKSWSVDGSAQLVSFVNEKIRKRMNPELKFLGIVINAFKVHRRIEQNMRTIIRRQYEADVFDLEIRDLNAYSIAAERKFMVVNSRKYPLEAQAIKNFYKEIMLRVQV